MTKLPSQGYSTRVKIYLLVDGRRLRVAQVGPSSLILREVEPAPPYTPAQVLICVDDTEDLYDVMLPDGIYQREVELADIG